MAARYADEVRYMIQRVIDENSPLGLFILSKAEREHRNPEEAAKEFVQAQFDEYIRTLHSRFMSGDFSQGALADKLGIPRLELIHLLENLGLPITNI